MQKLILILPTSRATGTIDEDSLGFRKHKNVSGTAADQVYNKNKKKQ